MPDVCNKVSMCVDVLEFAQRNQICDFCQLVDALSRDSFDRSDRMTESAYLLDFVTTTSLFWCEYFKSKKLRKNKR